MGSARLESFNELPGRNTSSQGQSSFDCEDTLKELKEQGLSDEELFEAVSVACLFHYMDRMADALGSPVEGFQNMMAQMSA